MKYQRLSFDMPENEHKYLKMCCAKLGVSLKDFITKAVIEKVDAQEDIWWMEKNEHLLNKEPGKTISHEDLCRELGIESNMKKKQETSLKKSPKTSKKGSSVPSKKGLSSRHRKLVNH